jgi:hypothetical protein
VVVSRVVCEATSASSVAITPDVARSTPVGGPVAASGVVAPKAEARGDRGWDDHEPGYLAVTQLRGYTVKCRHTSAPHGMRPRLFLAHDPPTAAGGARPHAQSMRTCTTYHRRRPPALPPPPRTLSVVARPCASTPAERQDAKPRPPTRAATAPVCRMAAWLC